MNVTLRQQLFVTAMFGVFVGIQSCEEDEPNCVEYTMTELSVEICEPNCINVLFQVRDSEGRGVVGLTTDKFNVTENDVKVGTEAGVTVVPNAEIPFVIKTILLLDVSVSVQGLLDQIKAAASSMVDNKATNQEISVWVFSSQPEMLIDFSGNKAEIKAAINGIEPGTSSTNLYGSLIAVSNLYMEVYTTSNIVAGNIIVFTDGSDSQASATMEEAQNALYGKDVYVVALEGPDFTPQAEESLRALETAGFFKASNINSLSTVFNTVVEEIVLLSQSVYWLYFSSPKRGANTHQLKVDVQTCGYSTSISRSFSSATFEDGTCSADGCPAGSQTGYNCVSGNCVSSSNGQYSTLTACQSSCGGGGGGGCTPDFTVSAPYSGPARSTCGAGNDCSTQTSPNHIYQVNIPSSGSWRISLCGSGYDTYLAMGSSCCSSTFTDDDGCSGTYQSQISTSLSAGTYYVSVEGYNGACGSYQLSVQPN